MSKRANTVMLSKYWIRSGKSCSRRFTCSRDSYNVICSSIKQSCFLHLDFPSDLVCCLFIFPYFSKQNCDYKVILYFLNMKNLLLFISEIKQRSVICYNDFIRSSRNYRCIDYAKIICVNRKETAVVWIV